MSKQRVAELSPLVFWLCVGRSGSQVGAASNVWKLMDPDGGGATAFPIHQVENEDGSYTIWFLTAAHVTRGGENQDWSAVLRSERVLFRGRHTFRHDYLDAAVVTFTSTEPVTLLHVDGRRPEFGEKVWTAGYPMLQGPFITEGIVSGEGMLSTEVYMTSSNAYYGNSGGPVIDSNGRVVGIIEAVGWDPFSDTIIPHMVWFVGTAHVVEWLEANGIY